MTEGENCYKELRSAGTAKKEILIPNTLNENGTIKSFEVTKKTGAVIC
jgi:hypothetical protein